MITFLPRTLASLLPSSRPLLTATPLPLLPLVTAVLLATLPSLGSAMAPPSVPSLMNVGLMAQLPEHGQAPSFSRPCRGSPTGRSSSSVCLDRVYTVNPNSCGMEVMFRSTFGRRAEFTFKAADPVNWHDACRRFLGSLVLIHRIVLPLSLIRTHQARAIISLISPGVAFGPTSPIGFGLFFSFSFWVPSLLFAVVSACVSLVFPSVLFPPWEEHSPQTTQDHQGNWLTSRWSQRTTIQADSSRSAGAREGPELVVQLSHWPTDVSP